MTDYTWPSAFVPTTSALTWHDNTVTFLSPLSGQVRTESRPGGRWKLQLTLENWKNVDTVDRNAIHQLEYFLFQLNGAEHRMIIPDFSYEAYGVGPTGTVRVAGAGQTGTTVTTDGWQVSTSGILVQGDRVSIEDHTYVLTQNVSSDVGGNATLYLHTPLRSAPADNAVITCDAPTNKYFLTNKVGFSSAPGVFKSVMLEFEEAL